MICHRCGGRLREGLSASENPKMVHVSTGREACDWDYDGFKAAHEQHRDSENNGGN